MLFLIERKKDNDHLSSKSHLLNIIAQSVKYKINLLLTVFTVKYNNIYLFFVCFLSVVQNFQNNALLLETLQVKINVISLGSKNLHFFSSARKMLFSKKLQCALHSIIIFYYSMYNIHNQLMHNLLFPQANNKFHLHYGAAKFCWPKTCRL